MSEAKPELKTTIKSWADEAEEENPPGLQPSPSALGPIPTAFAEKPREKKPDAAGTDAAPAASKGEEAKEAAQEASPAKKSIWDRLGKGAPAEGAAAAAPAAPAAPAASSGDSADKVAGALGTLNVAAENEDGTVDQPDPSLKTNVLNDIPELHEAEITKVVAGNTPYTSAKTFEELNLSEQLLQGLYSEMKFERPSKIQAVTLPMILQPPNADLIAQAHNGSGKTTCFVLGMLSRVDPNLKAPQALCVCPTRELAQQNESVLLKMGKYTGVTCACTASEGTGIVSSSSQPQLVDQVVIGTPGTLKRWMTKDRILPTKNIKILVFDEADHMLDQDGFQDDSTRIINAIRKSNPHCQIVLFSATFNERVKRFASRVVRNANEVYVPKEQLSLDVIKQYRVRVPHRDAKVLVVRDRIFPAAEKLGQTIIFVKRREDARNLHSLLEADGHKCTSIHGGMTHEERDSVIREFRAGTTKILIATDLLSRGFDQAQVTLVVNFDLPVNVTPPYEPQYETYLHRIGRSGRFGRKGAAFNLVCGAKDENNLNKIEQHFDKKIPEVDWMDDDAFEDVLKKAGLA